MDIPSHLLAIVPLNLVSEDSLKDVPKDIPVNNSAPFQNSALTAQVLQQNFSLAKTPLNLLCTALQRNNFLRSTPIFSGLSSTKHFH